MNTMSESKYIKQFKLKECNYKKKYFDKHNNVFNIPKSCTRWSTSWVLFPGPVFQPSVRAQFDMSSILGSRGEFSNLKQFLRDVGEPEFICFLLPSRIDPARIYRFPASIDWDTYSSGGPSSMVHLHNLGVHMFGRSGTWGAYYIEPWMSWVWGFRTRETLSTFRRVFEKDDDTKGLAEEYLDKLQQTKHWRPKYEEFVDKYMTSSSS